MNIRWAAAAIALFIAAFGGRKLWRWSEDTDARAREQQITHHVDLAQVPDPPPPSPPPAPPPHHRTAPVLVELTFRQAGSRTFRGHYQVIDNNGIVFTEGDAPEDGSSVALVLSPLDYEVRVGKHVRQPLSLRNAQSDKQSLRIDVPR